MMQECTQLLSPFLDNISLVLGLIWHSHKISEQKSSQIDPKITWLVEHELLMYVIVHSHRQCILPRTLYAATSAFVCSPPTYTPIVSYCIHSHLIAEGAGCGILTLTSDPVFDIWSQGSMCIPACDVPAQDCYALLQSIWSQGVRCGSKIAEQRFGPAADLQFQDPFCPSLPLWSLWQRKKKHT